ncbi:MAG: hypothetical protein CMI17_00710 [Opitutaceae bacterium]|nr:hypothetical protein [Opitutaceae bacterium]
MYWAILLLFSQSLFLLPVRFYGENVMNQTPLLTVAPLLQLDWLGKKTSPSKNWSPPSYSCTTKWLIYQIYPPIYNIYKLH